MKEELTREVVEAMSMCSHNVGCKKCAALYFCNGKMWPERCKWLATTLLEEMDKPKVWDGAPEWANSARVRWFKPDYPGGIDEFFSKLYTRDLPKTRAQKIADEIVDAINIMPNRSPIIEPTVETVLRVLEKYAAELGTTT